MLGIGRLAAPISTLPLEGEVGFPRFAKQAGLGNPGEGYGSEGERSGRKAGCAGAGSAFAVAARSFAANRLSPRKGGGGDWRLGGMFKQSGNQP